MDINHRIALGSNARRRGASLGAVLRCASWLVLASVLVACTPPSTVKPTPGDPVPPAPETPKEEDEGWKPVTG